MAHQSLYRRYRPRRFADVRGQDHVVGALRNAVAGGSEGHAYLFSGPRGTGKTSTARILAKALNCPNLTDGEPCGTCESCQSIEHGTSYDLFELDAASNNGVDAMRDLISRTVVGSPGRTKVYILDEVHMLSAAASNALLKTLEEPPEHVCFVLATTDPQKVLPTIRSRTQHFEFSLLSGAELTDYVRWIDADAGLGVGEDVVAHVVRVGRGSARDTLSALDTAVAAGGVPDHAEPIDEIVAALVDRDTARVLSAIADAVGQGREPRVLAEHLVTHLRDAFLCAVGAHVDHLSDDDQARMAEVATALGTPTITRALESIGLAIVDMRQAADPRVPLEVALIRLTAPSSESSLDALLERIEDLERRVARGAAAPAPAARPDPAPPAPAASSSGPPPPGPASVRQQLAEQGTQAPASPPAPKVPAPPLAAAPAPPPPPAAASPTRAPAAPKVPTPPPSAAPAAEPSPAPVPSPAAVAADAGPIDRDELAAAMTESVVPTLSGMAKSLVNAGRFVGEHAGRFRFALDNAPDHVLERVRRVQPDIESALATRLGRPVPIEIVGSADGAPPAAPSPSPSGRPASASTAGASAPAAPSSAAPAEDPDEDEHIDVSELDDASDVAVSGVDKLVQAFPGAEIIEKEPT